jgi:hypothetical protein
MHFFSEKNIQFFFCLSIFLKDFDWSWHSPSIEMSHSDQIRIEQEFQTKSDPRSAWGSKLSQESHNGKLKLHIFELQINVFEKGGQMAQ